MTDTLSNLPPMGWQREDEPFRAPEITQDQKDEYIRLIYEGVAPNKAAQQVGTTGTIMRRLRRPGGAHYDPAFHQAFTEAANSDTRRQNQLERIRDMQWERAEAGDTRMVEKLSLIHDPDWEPLRHTNLRVDIRAVFAKTYAALSDDEIERLVQAHEAAEQRQLQAHPDIEAK